MPTPEKPRRPGLEGELEIEEKRRQRLADVRFDCIGWRSTIAPPDVVAVIQLAIDRRVLPAYSTRALESGSPVLLQAHRAFAARELAIGEAILDAEGLLPEDKFDLLCHDIIAAARSLSPDMAKATPSVGFEVDATKILSAFDSDLVAPHEVYEAFTSITGYREFDALVEDRRLKKDLGLSQDG